MGGGIQVDYREPAFDVDLVASEAIESNYLFISKAQSSESTAPCLFCDIVVPRSAQRRANQLNLAFYFTLTIPPKI
jgi:hypothetical protein